MIKNEGIVSYVARNRHDLLLPLNAKDIHVTDLYPMSVQGSCNKMYDFSIAYNLGNCTHKKDFVLRTSRDHTAERIAREYKALKTLKALGMPVPTAVAFEENGKTFGAPFMIMDKINGASASGLMNGKQHTLAIVDMLAKLLVSLHKIDPAVIFKSGSLGDGPGQTARFRENVLCGLRELINVGYITSFSPFAQRKYLRAIVKLEKADLKDFCLCLIHGDFGPDHVLISNGAPVITDWEGLRLGDPAYDVGWAFHAVQLEGQILVDHRFVKTSKHALFDFTIGEEFVKHYKRYAGYLPANLEFYKNLAALKLAATLDLHVRPGFACLSRVFRLRPKEILSQTVFAYNAIRSFKSSCEFFLRQRNVL